MMSSAHLLHRHHCSHTDTDTATLFFALLNHPTNLKASSSSSFPPSRKRRKKKKEKGQKQVHHHVFAKEAAEEDILLELSSPTLLASSWF
ncbi:hypothetical protein SLA2020_284820 [Shorea laevis]